MLRLNLLGILFLLMICWVPVVEQDTFRGLEFNQLEVIFLQKILKLVSNNGTKFFFSESSKHISFNLQAEKIRIQT